MMRKMSVLGVCLVLSFIFCSVSEAKSLKKGEVYSLLNGQESMEVISSSELEITEGSRTLVAEYEFKGAKLRVVANVLGTKMVKYYLLTEQGLKEEGTGNVYYSKAGLAALQEEMRKAKAEQARKEAAAKAAKEKRIKEKFTFSGLTVLDNETKLMWTRDGNIAGKDMNWDDAFKFIEGLNERKYGGYSDWRLPSKEELLTLVNFAKRQGVTEKVDEFLNKIGFKNVQESLYWSSTTYVGNTPEAWGVDMFYGNVYYYYKSDPNYVLPVRAGQRGEGDSRDSSTTSEAKIGKEGKFFRIKERGMFCENPQVISKKTCGQTDAGEIVEYLNEDSGFFMKVKKENGQIGWIGRQTAEAQ